MSTQESCSVLLSRYTTVQEALHAQSCETLELPSQHYHVHNHDHDHDKVRKHKHTHGGCSGHEGPYSVGLHVGSIFVVLFASFLGAIIPLAGKYVRFLQVNQFMFVLGKCMATGVVLSVAAIHMINHAVHAFGEECVPNWWKESYDAYAFLFAMIAALLMHLLEMELSTIFSGFHSTPSSPSPLVKNGEKEVGVGPEERGVSVNGDGCADEQRSSTAVSVPGGSANRIVSALFMEFGVTLHSVFIGVVVGISGDAETKALLVALSFHQLFEGLALGSRLADASMRLTVDLLLALIFSFSAPLGAAIGVGTVVGSKKSVAGTTFVLLQAIFDATCGGILLYLGFALMLNDFPADLRKHAGVGAAHRVWRRVAMYVALWAGAGLMAGIGKWL